LSRTCPRKPSNGGANKGGMRKPAARQTRGALECPAKREKKRGSNATSEG